MSEHFYIHPDNPQQRLIQHVIDILKKGGIIAYPTDSGYALGCLLENKQGKERICAIRKLDKNHHFTLLCSDLSELSIYAFVDNNTFRLVKNNTPGTYTFILNATKEVPRRLAHEKRKTIALRIPSNPIALALLKTLQEPIMTTSLILPGKDYAESDPDEIEEIIGYQVDAIINGGNIGQKPTTVIDLTNGYPEIIRQGNGDITPFLNE